MKSWMLRAIACGLLCLTIVSMNSTARCTAAEPVPKPATVAEAAKALNLATFPRLPGALPPGQATLAHLSYSAPGKVEPAYNFQKATLSQLGWKELPGGYSSEQYASGTFAKNGFKVSVSVLPSGEQAGVTLISHGNVELSKLPLPAGTKLLFEGPVSRMQVTEAAPEPTKAACRELLTAQGWTPYGTAGDTQFFKQNAVRLGVTVTTAPGQGNKTVIDLQSTLMSADLPAPEQAEGLQYSDGTMAVSFDTPLSIPEVVEFYRTALMKTGWKATTEQPFQLGFRQGMIFRNPAKELAELQLQTVEGKTRALLKFQTAEMVAAEDAKAKAAIAAKAAVKSPAKPRITIALPAGAEQVEAKASSAELKLKPGQAKAGVEAWRRQFLKDGWKEEVSVLDPLAGSVNLKRGDVTLSITYVDPGFIPAEISLSVVGGELDLQKPK